MKINIQFFDKKGDEPVRVEIVDLELFLATFRSVYSASGEHFQAIITDVNKRVVAVFNNE
jgi:hypothetical protein